MNEFPEADGPSVIPFENLAEKQAYLAWLVTQYPAVTAVVDRYLAGESPKGSMAAFVANRTGKKRGK